ncbi:4-aminobutyrate--2-oxoglutarate transaminase [Priestia taiwanensis]|uniref:(S)-3-amino-2-methylpropionate transaminase n=1 Tax=Priestia taiwanensis TaxID=1347902 RepID=A0A917ENA4_9BACI|nr:4-aminobutyrate--2-oxoglutarate transaminase [Priestia taiwanensis]MBM7362129.1 4-aminobutyrate aminotransferase/(S)-3-amino-2-methylpropionate transaminase [Priestia taiwanensis]GGE59697.1 4-aminobutyrate--2-oxoglutarate transaminase [Priestia taiwanensis]
MQKSKKYIRVGNIPGEKSLHLLEERNKYVSKGVGNNTPIFVKRAHGALVEDVDGNMFLDFAGAIGSLNVGHTPESVVTAITEQAQAYIHPCFHVAMYEPYVQLAKVLVELTPGKMEKKAMLLNSGAEAVENAVKIARKYTGKHGIVSFSRGFHGRTLLAMSLTSKVKPYKYKMGPFAPAVYKAQYPYMIEKPESLTDEEYVEYCLHQFHQFFLTEVSPEEVAAVVMEPVQGEGGFIIPPKEFVQGVYEFCKKNDILFIADEIQTGFGRTGYLFASEHFEIEPDIMTLSKSLAAGFPISAVVARKEIMDAVTPGEAGGTYGGSPIGCAAALATIQKVIKDDLPMRAREIGKKIVMHFRHVQKNVNIIADVRGLGAMCAIEFRDPLTNQPLKEFVSTYTKACYEAGVIVLSAGIHSNVVRFLMPLVITDEELEEGLEVMTDVLKQLFHG